jgi:translocation and assembly module TamB
MRRALRWLAIAAFAAAVFAAAGVAVLRSGWFREQVRARIAAEVERASGGRAELRRFGFDWTRLEATAAGFTLRGTEAPDRAPLFRAEKITLRLTVRSWLRRRIDLGELSIHRPDIRIYVAADGTTNLPRPPVPAKSTPVETLLTLKIGRLEVRDGQIEYDSRQTPFHLTAESVGGRLDYDAGGPAYAASLAVKSLTLPGFAGLGVESEARIEAQRVALARLRVSRGGSWVEASGLMEDFRDPRVTLDWKAEADLAAFPQWKLASGRAQLEGRARYGGQSYEVAGIASVWGLGGKIQGVALEGLKATGLFELRPGRLAVNRLRAGAFGGRVEGAVELTGGRRFNVEADVSGIELERLRALVSSRPLPWNGFVSGPLRLSGEIAPGGVRGAVAEASVTVTPAEGQLALEGGIDARWTQQGNRIELRPSTLRSAASSLSVKGVLGERLTAGLLTRDPGDLEAVLALATGREDLKIPVALDNGEIRAEAVVEGPLENPAISGKIAAVNAVYQGVRADRAELRFKADSSSLDLANVDVRSGDSRGTGSLRLGLTQWRVTAQSAVNASVVLRQADLGVLLKPLRMPQPAAGRAGAKVELRGTLAEPEGKLEFEVLNAAYGREKFEKLAGDIAYRDAQPGQIQGRIKANGATVSFRGRYARKGRAWDEGRLEWAVEGAGIRLAESETLAATAQPVDGVFDARFTGVAELRPGAARIAAFEGALNGRGLTLATRPLGDFSISARTEGGAVRAAISGAVDGRPLRGDATISLSKGYPASLKLVLPRLPFEFLRSFAAPPAGAPAEPLPFEGFIEAEAEWSGPLETPGAGKALATIRRIEVRPGTNKLLDAQAKSGDLTLRNQNPIMIAIDAKSARIQDARFEARDTDFGVKGSYFFGVRSPLDLALDGRVNLAVLSSFRPDLLASGQGAVDARIRGTPGDPNLSGRMTVAGASFFLKDFPNGIENAKGAIHFERNRATIESLTGQTGGGEFHLTGFLSLSRGELAYRLAAKGGGIRVRYPEGVSTTLDADLTLTGSTQGGLLAGAITIQRSGFTPQTDFASAIAGSTSPVPAPVAQNELLRNLLFDIRVRTSPNATFETSYTQDVQTQADLRLRGSAAKPVLLGDVRINQGMINFFGNRYTVSRGEILFYNTAAIMPSIDLDLETRVRGVIVYINVSGPLSRLNVTYRSDPPFQTNEILALLTVGRAPAPATGMAIASGGVRSPNVLETGMGGNTLLGGALSAGVNSRVERFFGASRIKIDPHLTGVDNIPQARLTVEQSLSRDITVTFVTNLSRSQQQLVRLEWDLSRAWSLVALRDENGIFGVDFLFRKRFK